MLEIIILAAGKGTRMRSSKPKVLHTLAGKPFVEHVINRCMELNADKIHLVVGHGAAQVEQQLSHYQQLNFVMQEEQLGTGHAVQQVLPHLSDTSNVLILYGDVPLIRAETLSSLLDLVSQDSMGLLTVELAEPKGYGRIVREKSGKVCAIVEQKDAVEEQLRIKEVNTGVMALSSQCLRAWLPALSNENAQGEYYLTDVIEMACRNNTQVFTAQPATEGEVMGVNNRQQQAALEKIYQWDTANRLMAEGVTLMDPGRFDCRGSITAGEDCVIDINCVIEGTVTLGNNVRIGPSCILKDCTIGENTDVLANSVIEEASVAANCSIGPFARLRPGTELSDGVKIGNFVETKKASIGNGSKVNHLSYIGDADVGSDVNIGAGTITCNYDGANKHQTRIEDNVFVGSNTALVAPVTLAKGSTVGAGSTITRNALEYQLVLTRSRQKAVDGWKKPEKK